MTRTDGCEVDVITEVDGNIFDADVDAIVVTVNTVGEMGAGIALEARLRMPEMAEAYREQCESGRLDVGMLWLWRYSDPKVLCFPTKKHWRYPSQLSYIRAGLDKLVETYRERGLQRIAVPHLGADRGGLDWASEVRPLVVERLDPLSDLEVVLYGYDPSVPDALFERLTALINGMTVERFAEQAGLRRREAELVHRIVMQAPYPNPSVLHRTRGIGITTLERVYAFAREAGATPLQETLPFE